MEHKSSFILGKPPPGIRDIVSEYAEEMEKKFSTPRAESILKIVISAKGCFPPAIALQRRLGIRINGGGKR
jgi:hypothetical protein